MRVKKITLPHIIDNCNLFFAQTPKHLPFGIKRVYFITESDTKLPRGFHAHKENQQAIFCLQGSIKLILDDGKEHTEIILNKPNEGVIIDKLIWHEMHNFKKNTILLVLASDVFREKDYIRSYEQFIKIKKTHLRFNNLNDQGDSELKNAFEKVLSSGNFILNKEVKNFEKQFAGYNKSKYCIGVANGLEALQISLIATDIGNGDEIITTPISAVATSLAILAVGATPVFVDTKGDGLINPDLIQEAITKKTKAILPVHLYGNNSDIQQIKSICQINKLLLIEDAAQAHGSEYLGKKLGSFGNLGCFSFYPTKNLGALGDGGAIITNNSHLAKICYQIRDYGQSRKYQHSRFGLNSRLDELQAALLSVKLKHLNSDNNKRRRLAQKYIRNLSDIPFIKMVLPENIIDANFHLFVIKTKKRNGLINYLRRFGVPTAIHYPKIIPDQPFLKGRYDNVLLPNARKFVNEIISLPIYPNMPMEQVDFISNLIKDFYSGSGTNMQ